MSSSARWFLSLFILSNFIVLPIQAITSMAFAQSPSFEIEINDTSTQDDDYFCWTPIPGRVRIVGGTNPIAVQLTSRTTTTAAVEFQIDSGARPTSASFAPQPSISLTIPADGNWVQFWLAGSAPSSNGKDVEIIVTRSDTGTEVAKVPVMVRVRKDATTLNAGEVRRLLDALRSHHDVGNGSLASQYIKYATAHERAFTVGIHHGGNPRFWPLFLAWHRAFLLSLERELQSFDRTVTLPYWRFDQDDPTPGTPNRVQLFSPQFMGVVSGVTAPGGFLVEFDAQNPLRDWSILGKGALVRRQNGSTAAMPAGRLMSLFNQTDGQGRPVNTTYLRINGTIEGRYHNGAHNHIGGWLASGDSPTDPLFYLLHANVDRAWAAWQQREPSERFNQTLAVAYHAQGAYPGDNGQTRFRKGSYALDDMWPWGDNGGNQQTPDPLDDWPTIDFELPNGPGVGGTSDRPTPATMIDYLDRRGNGTGINACYDHILFK